MEIQLPITHIATDVLSMMFSWGSWARPRQQELFHLTWGNAHLCEACIQHQPYAPGKTLMDQSSPFPNSWALPRVRVNRGPLHQSFGLQKTFIWKVNKAIEHPAGKKGAASNNLQAAGESQLNPGPHRGINQELQLQHINSAMPSNSSSNWCRTLPLLWASARTSLQPARERKQHLVYFWEVKERQTWYSKLPDTSRGTREDWSQHPTAPRAGRTHLTNPHLPRVPPEPGQDLDGVMLQLLCPWLHVFIL